MQTQQFDKKLLKEKLNNTKYTQYTKATQKLGAWMPKCPLNFSVVYLNLFGSNKCSIQNTIKL